MHATDSMRCPRYTALDFDGESIEADDNLSVVLDALRKSHDPADQEELVVWKDGQTVAAVMRADGTITMFEPIEPAPSKPANGKSRRRR